MTEGPPTEPAEASSAPQEAPAAPAEPAAGKPASKRRSKFTRTTARVTTPKPEHRAKPAKATNWELQERREKVKKLRMRGLSLANIAKLLNTNAMSVQRDLEVLQQDSTNAIDSFAQNQFVGAHQDVLNEVIERAWGEYHAVPEGHATRLKALDLVRATQNDKLRALTETGMIRREPQTVEVKHTFSLPWDEDTKHDVARALLERALTKQLPAPQPEVVPDRPGDVLEVEVLPATDVEK